MIRLNRSTQTVKKRPFLEPHKLYLKSKSCSCSAFFHFLLRALSFLLRTADFLVVAAVACDIMISPLLSFERIFLCVAVIVGVINSASDDRSEVNNTEKCGDGLSIYGPGWEQPELILPSRYFFIQVPDQCDKQSVDVHITSPLGYKDCQVKLQVLHPILLDLVIVRYRLLSLSCPNGFTIRILHKESGQILAEKMLSSEVRSEECLCRSPDFSVRMGCPKDLKLSRIDQDLR